MKKLGWIILFVGLFLEGKTQFEYPAAPSKWKMDQAYFSIGLDGNRYESMTFAHLMAFARDPDQLQRDLSGFTEEITSTTAGLAFYTGATLHPFSYQQQKRLMHQELRIGFALYTPKEAMISYKDESRDTSICTEKWQQR